MLLVGKKLYRRNRSSIIFDILHKKRLTFCNRRSKISIADPDTASSNSGKTTTTRDVKYFMLRDPETLVY